MSLYSRKQPAEAAAYILRRAEISKIANRLQDRLALAHLKTKHGWEELNFDIIERRMEEEMRGCRVMGGDVLSDSSSAPDPIYPATCAHVEFPFEDALFPGVAWTNDCPGHQNRASFVPFDDHLTQTSTTKPIRSQRFTTSRDPEVLFCSHCRLRYQLSSLNDAAPTDDDDDDDWKPTDSSAATAQFSPRRHVRSQCFLGKRGHGANDARTVGEDAPDLVLHPMISPSALGKSSQPHMKTPSTPPPPNHESGFRSFTIMTPGGGNVYFKSPDLDLSDFVNITPSPA